MLFKKRQKKNESRGALPGARGVGGSRDARHNALRDYIAKNHKSVTGMAANTEQRVPAWDRIAVTGELEEARPLAGHRNGIPDDFVFAARFISTVISR